MPVLTEVEFEHEDGALADTFAALPDLDVEVMRETSTTPHNNVYFLRIECDSAEEVHDILDKDHTVSEAQQKPKFDRESLWTVKFAPETKLLAPQVTQHGGLVLDARNSDSPTCCGWNERWMLPDREAIQDIWQHARNEGFRFDLLEFHQGGGTDGLQIGRDALTDPQRRTLEFAYENGYFAEPRETSLEELGDALDLSASAVGGRLKRGLKTLVGETLVVEGREKH